MNKIPLAEGERVPKEYRRRFIWESEGMRQEVIVDGRAMRDGFLVKFYEKNMVPFPSSVEESESMDWLGMVISLIRHEIGAMND